LEGGSYFLARELFSPQTRRHLIPSLRSVSALPYSDPPIADPFNRTSVLELTHYTRNVLLRDTDSMSMAHGLEVRVPFLDHRLVEFVLRLPGDVKRGQADYPKALLVDAVANMLPEMVQRPKQGFTLPFARWLRGSLRDELESTVFSSNGFVAAAEFNTVVAKDMWKRFLEGRSHWVRPWALYVLKKWCAHYL
jgi:asparagine synthase (glutamine-hydrolysing)